MTTEKATRPHRSPHSNQASCRDAPNEVERSKLSRCQPAESTINGPVGLVDGSPLQTLSDAVDDQRMKLLNVLGIVHSMSAFFTDTAADTAPEIAAAFELLEREIQCVVAGLREASLQRNSRLQVHLP